MRQIIALGGGGFSMEPENPLLDEYILNQAGKPNPKICYVPTASGDSDIMIQSFYDFFNNYECTPSHLSLFKPPVESLEKFVLDKDIIYVGGGNTRNLLILWKEWGLHTLMKEAWERGIVLAGISAGSICWFEQGVTDSYGDELQPLDCLGFLKGSNCPHYDGELNRRPAYQKFIASDQIKPGIAADDGAAIHFKDEEIYKVVCSRPHAKAYQVYYEQGIKEIELQTEYLESL
ncbi:peptidase E [Halobacillus massiliensis]|uniref:Type 1 glutamine amidotransferase-like domain-containing protein n=1 Tax=Halobacillus massiliensis TaxID=1926286 RepID=UPI0009E5E0F4|nr:peptidase E [Halobacillus massiliensis]